MQTKFLLVAAFTDLWPPFSYCDIWFLRVIGSFKFYQTWWKCSPKKVLSIQRKIFFMWPLLRPRSNVVNKAAMTLLASFACPILVIFGENVVFKKLYHLAEEKIQNGHFCGPEPTYCIKRPCPISPDLFTPLVLNLAELKVLLRAIISTNIFWNGRLGGQWTKKPWNSKY